ncbi:MAG TPA: hypothetical protein VL945_01620, partial [Candidatus Saccharimonadales bacterium]|nr:hypothetical protein [Candidatus Saccharimonadales bacterium]
DDWLKKNAVRILGDYKYRIEASESVFVELMLVAKRYNLDPMQLTSDVMKICQIEDTTYLKAAYFIKKGAGVLDAFHASHVTDQIISSDSIYDRLEIKRIKLESAD